MLKQENRQRVKDTGAAPFKFLMSLTSDPEQEAEKLGVRFDESKISVLVSMITHALFLAIFCTALFIRMDLEAPFRMQFASKNVLFTDEVQHLSNVYFNNVVNVEQVQSFITGVLVPNLYKQTWYNGVPYTAASVEEGLPDTPTPREPYTGSFFADSSVTLGSIRMRQVRSLTIPCTSNPNSTSFLSTMGYCHAHYQMGVSDVREIVDEWVTEEIQDEGKANETVILVEHSKTTKAYFTMDNGEEFEYQTAYRLEDDGPWQSPKTLVTYDAGGFVEDLPTTLDQAVARVNELFENGFVDQATRALFLDYSLYNNNVDMFLSARVVFEMPPTGPVLPFADLIPAALITDVRAFEGDNSSTVDLLQVIFEFFLYACIIAYLTRAADDLAEYPSIGAYLINPWNSLDIMNVICFLAVIAIRVFWMINAAKFQYGVGNELSSSDMADRNYNPLRLPVVYYSFGKTFFAFGTLLSFVKTFRYIGVSRRLTMFTETISAAVKDMGVLMGVFVVILCGFSCAFHIAFGTMSREFKDFPSSALSLLLAGLGDFDAQALRVHNPVLGMILFAMYSIIMVFVILSMMLKIVDNAFIEMRAKLLDTSNLKENMGMQLKLALRKIFYDYYWYFKMHAVLKSAAVTEKLIEKLNKSGQLLKDKTKLGGDADLLDDSVADMLTAERDMKEAEEKRLRTLRRRRS
jgi:hypothetical protein